MGLLRDITAAAITEVTAITMVAITAAVDTPMAGTTEAVITTMAGTMEVIVTTIAITTGAVLTDLLWLYLQATASTITATDIAASIMTAQTTPSAETTTLIET